MKKYPLKKAEIVSFIIASILGVIFHFVYEWTNENPVIGLFFPVNESTWEHLKLIFFPILLVSIIEYFALDTKYQNFICTKLTSALIGMALTVILFYTYVGISGKNSDVLNISIYFVSMAIAYRFSYHKLSRNKEGLFHSSICYWGFALLAFLFMIFTVFPPDIPLFEPPML